MTWAGSRYRTFDGTHFHFSSECTYTLAAAADGTWAIAIAAGNARVLAVGWSGVGWERSPCLITNSLSGGCGAIGLPPWHAAALWCGCGVPGHPRLPALALADAAPPQGLHMTFGVGTVVAQGRSISVDGVVVPEGQPYLHNGEGRVGGQPMVALGWGLGGAKTPDGTGDGGGKVAAGGIQPLPCPHPQSQIPVLPQGSV